MSTIATRPHKLTPPRQKALLQALKSGCDRKTAAAFAGVHESTLWRWVEQGRCDAEAARKGPKTACQALYEQITEVESQTEIRALAMVQQAAPTDWKAAAWLLERKWPTRYGRSDRLAVDSRSVVEHTHRHTLSEEVGGGQQPIQMDPAARRKAAELLQAAADEAAALLAPQDEIPDAEVVEDKLLPAAVRTVLPSEDHSDGLHSDDTVQPAQPSPTRDEGL